MLFSQHALYACLVVLQHMYGVGTITMFGGEKTQAWVVVNEDIIGKPNKRD